VVLSLLALAVMVGDHRAQLGQPVRDALSLMTYPVHFLVNLPGELGGFMSERVTSRRTLIEDNARLRAQHLLYETRLQRLEALERENMNLRDLLQSSYQIGEPVIIAELLRVNLDPYSHLLQINKGRTAGVYVGQSVLDAKGIMGQIDQAGPLSATVRLITDPNHAIPVRVNRNGLRAIALGTGDLHRLELANLPNNADIAVGDLLVSSGLGERFPPGYPVATVTSVETGSGQAFARVEARPLALLDRSREVLLVRPQIAQPVEASPRDGSPAATPDATQEATR
jgi:rod shape-determining protein MreC